MALTQEALDRLGELFIIGFQGTTVSDDTAAFLSQAGIGGVIYFKHNYESPEQVANLSNQIQECRNKLPLWISVDHEGGRVQRFKEPFTLIPTAEEIAAKDSPKLAFSVSEIMAKELAAVGVNLNFCPVTDINTNPANPIIGDRAFGTTADQVTKLTSAMARGHVTNGVQPCVKHFPGHGDTKEDSHFYLPKVETDVATLESREFKPFIKAFKSRVSMVMTAHIINPHIDPELPATLSTKTLQGILRDKLRYNKLIISDDMEMKAITDNFGAEDAPKMAIEAGCDLLIYRSEEAARKAYTALKNKLENEEMDAQKVVQAAERSRKLKEEFFGDSYQPVNVGGVKSEIGKPEYQEIIGQIRS